MASYHLHHANGSKRSQEKKFRRIRWMRMGKKWLKKILIGVIVVLALAVALSYLLITKEPEPQEIEIHKPLIKGF